jgi:glycosyltransferase involved in cell wall biosynthesis
LIKLVVRFHCWKFRAAYRLADYLMKAENDAGVANFTRRGVPRSKILRYRNAVDTDTWVPAKEKRQPFTFVCWSSSHGLRKGLPSLVSAWRQWYRGQAAELWLVGISTVVSDRLFGHLTQGEPVPGLKLNLGFFPGQYRPVIDFIGSCHVAVFPTLEDAQPSALLEMTSCGLPVITTVESGVEFPETFCRYVARDAPEKLAEALEYWFSRRQELEGPGLAARAYIEGHHTWSSFHSRFTEILTELIARRRWGER